VALSAIALVSVAEAKRALGIEDSFQDAVVEDVIDKASALAETVYCHRPLKRRAVTDLRVEGPAYGRRLYPVIWPIDTAGLVTVAVNGVSQTLWKTEGDGDPGQKNVQVYPDHFYRAAGWSPTGSTERNVVLTYSGGYDPVPEDLQEAALEVILKIWGPIVKGMPELASYAGPGGSIQTLDGQWAGGTAITSYALSRRAKDVFDAYRMVKL
jgi:hypothetical protein